MSHGFAPGVYAEHSQALTHAVFHLLNALSPPVCLIFLQSAFRHTYVHWGGKKRKNCIPGYNYICEQHNRFMTPMTLAVSCWLFFPVMLHVKILPQKISFMWCCINTKYEKHVLLSISVLLSAVMMYFTWQPQWNSLHPGDGTERRKMEFHLLNAKPIFNYTKTLQRVC